MEVDEKIENFNGRGEVRELVPVQDQNSPANIMRIALTHGQDLVEVEKMLNLQIKWEENEAKKAYFDAVAQFNESPPAILKDKSNTQFKGSRYTSLGNLLQTVNPALGKYGLSASFIPSQAENEVKLTCKLSHRLGHSESVTMTAPPDTSGGASKNPIQQIKSTFTYLRAMTFEAVTGLSAVDEANLDDDGNTAYSDDFITEAQLKELVKEKEAVGMTDKLFLRSLKIDVLSELPANRFKFAMGILKARKGQ